MTLSWLTAPLSSFAVFRAPSLLFIMDSFGLTVQFISRGVHAFSKQFGALWFFTNLLVFKHHLSRPSITEAGHLLSSFC